MKNHFFDKLLWVDIEYTTLDYLNSKILEFAAIVTDESLNEVARREWVVNHGEDVLEELKQNKLGDTADKPELMGLDTIYDLHEQSGLLGKVTSSKQSSQEVEEEVVEFTKWNIGEERVILAGNSIHADRRVVSANWPNFERLLHYRMVDVSTFKLIFGNHGKLYEKKNNHRAIDDVEESIAELKFYLKGKVSK